MHAPQGAPAPDLPRTEAMPGARTALLLLVFINLFNYIDRQVLAAVEPEIRKELLKGVPDEQAKFQMGLLATAFLVSYMLFAPVFGILATRYSRWFLVGFGVVLWSLASGASGFRWEWLGLSAVASFWALLLTRCFVGLGEAAYGPVAPAMIADLYPVQRRGMVLAWFYMAIPVGGALGYALGEVIQENFGWREAFYCVVPPGILLGVLAFLMRDPPKGHTESVAVETKNLTVRDMFRLLRIPSYAFNTAGMTLMTFAIGGLAFWMPAYLESRGDPTLGPLGPRTAFGAITAFAGLVSTLAGGLAGDWLRRYVSGSYFLVSGTALILGFPMILGFLWTPFPWAWLFVFGAVFCLFFNTGPTNTILANVTHPTARASGFALNILLIHLFGDAISPPLIGWISGVAGLNTGFILVSAVMAVGGLLWLWGSRYLEEDTKLAPTRL